MTKSKIIVAIFVLFISVSTFGQYTKWEKDVSFQGIEFEKIRFREDGKESLFAKGVLKQKTIIDGYPCHQEIILTKDGQVKFFILAEDFELVGNVFRKNTKVHIRSRNDYLIHCLYEANVQGYQIRKTNYKKPLFMGDTNFSLYPSGKLKFFQPIEDIDIEGIWCKPSSVRGGVTLFENGKLKECTSAKKQTIQGQKVDKNYTLKFEKNGKLYYAKKEKIFGSD